ncbi:MAG TPA: hypothetical protein P5136_00995 [Methanofastidiosum sp.]|nr:hypothetical protein [Methanofastidiosum sp.]
MIEASIVTYEGKIIDIQKGEPAEVKFNFERIWQFKSQTPDFDPIMLDFYHVHPAYLFSYSDKDINCMEGLKMAFGESIAFHIITFKDITNIFDLQCFHKCYLLLNETEIREKDIPYESTDKTILSILKLLAYGDEE